MMVDRRIFDQRLLISEYEYPITKIWKPCLTKTDNLILILREKSIFYKKAFCIRII